MQNIQTACWDREMHWKSDISGKWMKGKQAKKKGEIYNMKNFFKSKDDWSSAHSHIWVYGATAEQVINAARKYEDYEEYFFNGTEGDGLVYFQR